MALANKAISVVYIQQNQSPAEQRFGLNLMISMLNQNKNSAGETLLPDSVIKLAELLIGTGTTRFLIAEQLLKLLAAFSKDDIPPDYIKAIWQKYLTVCLMNLRSRRLHRARNQDSPRQAPSQGNRSRNQMVRAQTLIKKNKDRRLLK